MQLVLAIVIHNFLFVTFFYCCQVHSELFVVAKQVGNFTLWLFLGGLTVLGLKHADGVLVLEVKFLKNDL